VPSSEEFDFFVYQVIAGQELIFEQYRVPDEHGHFFEKILQTPQVLAINKENYMEFECFMTDDFRRFIAADSFIIMSVYLMDHPIGIIYAIPEDPEKQCNQDDYEAFQELATHFYKGIETMVDIV
jgi:hypothetical protein